MRNFVVVLVLVIQTVIAQNNNKNIVREGAPCELSLQEKGICIRLSLCSSARELLKQHKIPETCGLINGVKIICCPNRPRKIIRLAEKKCKYVELSRFGFIADTLSSESFTPEDQNPTNPIDQNPTNPIDQNPTNPKDQNPTNPKDQNPINPEEKNNNPLRIKIPAATTQQDEIPKDFSRFPLEEEIENKFNHKNEKTNIIPLDFSRFPSIEEKPDFVFEDDTNIKFEKEPNIKFEKETNKKFEETPIKFEEEAPIKFEEEPDIKFIEVPDFKFEQEEKKSFPLRVPRFAFDENESREYIFSFDDEANKPKIHTGQAEFSIPMDFSRFSYSPTNEEGHLRNRQKSGDHPSINLIQYESDSLPKLDHSSKIISDWIIRETPNYVLGGQNAKESEFPHMAALGYEFNNKTNWLCGGSLISDQYVLTAAHCLNSLDFGPLKWIRLGEINRESVSLQSVHQDFRVEKSIPYPLYRPSSTYHDIALVKLDRKPLMNSFVNTACLFTAEKTPPSLELWATGWGLTTEGGNQSEILQKVELNVFSEEECNKVYQVRNQLKYGILPKQQICAGGRVNQKDTCKGDSGGPLQIKMSRDDGDIYYIAGVTSFGKQCGNKNIPGIYTRVSFYISWIENIIWPDDP